jgi:hypothetical protein
MIGKTVLSALVDAQRSRGRAQASGHAAEFAEPAPRGLYGAQSHTPRDQAARGHPAAKRGCCITVPAHCSPSTGPSRPTRTDYPPFAEAPGRRPHDAGAQHAGAAHAVKVADVSDRTSVAAAHVRDWNRPSGWDVVVPGVDRECARWGLASRTTVAGSQALHYLHPSALKMRR